MADAEAPVSDFIRVKRKRTTIFLLVDPTDTAHDLRAKINLITKVPVTDIKFYLEKGGEMALDEQKSLADQKVRGPHIPARRRAAAARAQHPARAAWPHVRSPRTARPQPPVPPRAQIVNDDELYLIYRKEGSDEWEEIDIAADSGS